MKKLLTVVMVLAAIALFSNRTYAQAYKQGDKLLNLGIGLRSYWIPIGGSFEYGINDQISVGALAYYAKWSDFGGTTLYLAGRGSYHLNELLKIDNDKLDIYAGAGLGYQSWSYSGVSGSYASGVYFLIHAGGRYYLSDNFGIHAELGSGVATLLAGVALKF